MFGWVSEIDRLKLRPENERGCGGHDDNQARTMSSVSSFASTSEEGEGGEVCLCTPDRVLSCSCSCL